MLLVLAGCLYIPEQAVQDRLRTDTADTASVPRWYADLDGDGSGDPDSPSDAAEQPEGYVDNAWDCVDTDPTEPVWVATDGLASGVGSMDDPLASISAAIAAAEYCVRIRAGSYEESLATKGKVIDVQGVDGSAKTKVKAVGQSSVLLEVSSETVTLKGLTLTGGTGTLSSTELPYYVGGGIAVYDSVLNLEDIVLTGNMASTGGGIAIGDGDSPGEAIVTMENVWVVGNQAENAGGILLDGGTLRAHDLHVLSNTALVYGGAGELYDGVAELRDLVVDADRGEDGVDGIFASAMTSLLIEDATLVDLDTALQVSEGKTVVTNAIFAKDTVAIEALVAPDLTVNYSDAYGAPYAGVDLSTSVGNLDSDPMFTDLSADGDGENDTLTLKAGSPCMDAGDPALTDADGSRSDMGASAR